MKGFSARSQGRVKAAAADAAPALVSQFALTYHTEEPDGKEAKEQLHAWFVHLRRVLPGVGYLWVMEWQSRGVLHFHIFLTVPVGDAQTWDKLAEGWNRITGEDAKHLWFHGSERAKNWISWDMGEGSYVAKYVDKKAQKQVPEGWGWVGRFWGKSRGLVPSPETVEPADLCAPSSTTNPAAYLVRTLERYHGAKLRKYGRRSRMFKRRIGGTVFGGARIAEQAMQYLERWSEAEAMGRRGPWGKLP